MKTGLHIALGNETRNVAEIELLAEPPRHWVEDVRAGRCEWNLTDCMLHLDKGKRRVYWDGAPFVVHGSGKLRLEGDLLEAVKTAMTQVWRAMDIPPRKRRSRADTLPMPDLLGVQHVKSVDPWPLGEVMTRKAEGENWTDCLIELIDQIRLGGKHNSRRVRYDGAFYIMHNGRRVQIGGELALHVLDVASHVYGLDAESDKLHNVSLKGY